MIDQIIEDFFKSPVSLENKGFTPDIRIGDIWQENSDGWAYPWRVTSINPPQGYPCGRPRKL